MNNPLQILILEDLISDADLLKYEISKNNIQYTHLVVETENDYKDAVLKFKPDIILSDYSLPTYNGMLALEYRNDVAPEIPFILVTGSLNEEIAVDIMKHGADDYVLKEHLTRIGTAIAGACEKHALIRKKNEAEELLRIVFMAIDQNPASIVITDTKGLIEYVNPKFTALTGYSFDELVGKKPGILRSGYTSESEYKNLWNTISSGKTWKGEFQNLKKNGDFYFESALISPIIDESGTVTHYVAVKEDISQNKLAEKKIKLLNEAIEQSPVSIVITDSEGKIEFVNRQFTVQTQYTLEEVSGKSPRIFNRGHIPDDEYDQMWNMLKAGERWQLEYNNRKKDGTFYWESLNISPLLDHQGKIANYILVTEDISAKIFMLQNLMESKEIAELNEKRYRSLFENLIEGFSLCKMIFEDDIPVDFVYLEVNHSFENLTGLKNVIGKRVSEVIPRIRESDSRLFEIYGRVVKTGKHERFEMYVESLKEWFSVSVYSPEKDYFVTVFDVITQRKNTEEILIHAKEKAEESDRLKTAFLHNISHEIRTPLNAIIGFSSLLANSDFQQEKKDEFMNIIDASNNQLLAIISGILSLSTLEAGQEKYIEQETNLNEIVATVFNQFNVGHNNPAVKLSYKTALLSRESVVLTDPVKLMQIMVNLVGNALKFTAQGEVQFGYEVNMDIIEFFVKDTGIGIPEEDHVRIFERFRQLDNSATRKFGGIGLGLALSKGYIELLGGSVTLESKPGNGSLFRFTIPFKPVKDFQVIDGVNENSDSELAAFQSKSILVVEDDFNSYLLIENFLESLTHNIIHAENGQVAVRLLEKRELPVLVLLDIMMPVMNGMDTIGIIKKHYPELPVIAVTAYANEEDLQEIKDAGFDDYVSKPIRRQVLMNKIRKYLE
ncbi:MAG TPA: PAS domain S-box protein [Bacteroidales bacterium]|nr:PAS domain S-box protein [Bacteroidales bacterium]